MAHISADRVKETTTTTGTGALTLAGAVTGFRAFSAVMAASDTCYYCIVGGTEWEVGIGTYNTTLTRTDAGVFAGSSGAGTRVNFSAGTKDVFITIAATRAAIQDANESIRVSNNSAANPVSVPLTNYLYQVANYTLTSTTSEQKLFDQTANGRLTLPTGFYYFECWFYLTGMSATSGSAAFDPIGAGTAVADRFAYDSFGLDNNTQPNAVLAIGGVGSVTQQTGANVVVAGTGTGMRVRLQGVFRISTGGTIIPSISLVTAAAAVVNAGSNFMIQKIGESSEATVGAWD